MSKRYPGGIITNNLNITPTPEGGAPGIWTLDQALEYIKLGTWPSPTDPYFNQTTLLLHGDGTNGAQNNTFLDSSTNNFTITRNGNTTQGSFSPFSVGAGEWSNYFDGNGDCITTPSNAAFAIGTGNFTIEMFASFTAWSGTNQRIFLQDISGSTNLQIYRDSGANNLVVYIAGSSIISYAWTPNIGQFYHIAVVRSGTGSNQVALYIDGVSVATGTSAGSIGQQQVVIGGLDWAANYSTQGYLSNVRYSNIARSISVPTSPYSSDANTLLLTCQSNRFVDNSGTPKTITTSGTPSVQPFSPFAPSAAYSPSVNGGSGYFDGTGDYLTVPDSADFSLGSNNFCLEAWVYAITAPTYAQICGQFGPGGVLNSDRAYWIRFDAATGKIQGIVTNNGSSETVVTDASVLTLNSWHHVAFVRNGNDLYLYVDGTQVGTTSFASSVHDSSHTFSIGGANNGVEIWNGYISNVRLVNGTAVYTSAFTPPTAPLTAIANTSLLTNFTNAGIFDNTGKNNLETVGNAQIDTTTKKYGTGSMEFDGTGDYLKGRVTSFIDFGSGNFTIECWVNLSANNQFNPIVLLGRDTQSGLYCDISSSNNARIVAYIGGVWGVVATGSTALSTSTWYHLAFVRNGSSFKIYVDGNEDASATDSGTISNPTSDASASFQVAYLQTSAAANRYFNGFIDDLRITKGVARYTANFTPPGGPFQNS